MVLQTGKLNHTNENEEYLVGNFADKRSDYSLGLFIAKMNNNEQQFVKYYDFTDLKNFF